MDVNDKRIAVLYLGIFPEGTASALRVYSYCKSIAQKGIPIKVFIIAPSKEAESQKYKSGKIEGVEFEYVTKATWNRKPNMLVKFFYYVLGIFITINKIHLQKYNAVLTYHNTFLSSLVFTCYCCLKKIPFVIDKTEYPYYYNEMNVIRRMITHFNLSLFSGIITITKELFDFYSKFNSAFLLPMTVNPSRFKGVNKNNIYGNYIGVVVGNHNRDGLFDTIKVYNEYVNLKLNESVWNLCIVGNVNSKPDYENIINFIKQNQLEKNINFIGPVEGNVIPSFLKSAKCLLTTPSSFPSGGFPTKLGEYLLSETPVVSTILGEIPVYLKEGIDFYGALPQEHLKLAECIIEIQNNPFEASQIALNGKNAALIHFNASSYIDDLLAFIYNLK